MLISGRAEFASSVRLFGLLIELPELDMCVLTFVLEDVYCIQKQ